MKITLGRVRRLIREAGKIGASSEYMKKERVREQLQQVITDHVRSGEISDDESLKQFIKDVDLSMTSLKMIPFEVWKKLSGSSKKQKK